MTEGRHRPRVDLSLATVARPVGVAGGALKPRRARGNHARHVNDDKMKWEVIETTHTTTTTTRANRNVNAMGRCN